MSKYPNTLGRIEAVWNKLGGEEGVDRFLRGEFVVSPAAKTVSKLLEPCGAPFTVSGAKEFVAKKKFIVNKSEDARVRITWLGDNFKKVMLPKTERNIAETELRFSKLRKASLDPPIIAELGDRAEITLCAFYETLAHKQVIRDYEWVVAYIRDADGVLWAVNARWGGDGWSVGADSVEHPRRWDAGGGFVSR